MPHVARADGGHLRLRSERPQDPDRLGHLQRSPGTVWGGDRGTRRAASTWCDNFQASESQTRSVFLRWFSVRRLSKGFFLPSPPRPACRSSALRFSRHLHESLRRAPLPPSLQTPSLSLLSASHKFFKLKQAGLKEIRPKWSLQRRAQPGTDLCAYRRQPCII